MKLEGMQCPSAEWSKSHKQIDLATLPSDFCVLSSEFANAKGCKHICLAVTVVLAITSIIQYKTTA